MGDTSVILAIDPATNTGWAAFTKEIPVAYFSHGRICPNKVNKLKDYYEQITQLIVRIKPNIVYVEDFHFNSHNACGSGLNFELRAVIYLVLQQHGVPYEIVNQSTWKKFVTGRGRPSTLQVERWGKSANKEYVRQALLDKKFVADANMSTDEVDAYGILYYAMNK